MAEEIRQSKTLSDAPLLSLARNRGPDGSETLIVSFRRQQGMVSVAIFSVTAKTLLDAADAIYDKLRALKNGVKEAVAEWGLACPFCSSAAAPVMAADGHFSVECMNADCGVRGPREVLCEDAVKGWNQMQHLPF